MTKMKFRYEKDYFSSFDEKTGQYVRVGVDSQGNVSDRDPFMTSFPELLDVGIMGHCRHGRSGLCLAAGIGCYQDGFHSQKANMTPEDFAAIAEQCRGKTFQMALGGCGDPDQHRHFEEILKICQSNEIVPNFTTSGFGMTKQTASLCQKYCGAVAVSWYRSDYTLEALKTLLSYGVKTNIHYVLSNSTLEEAFQRLKNDSGNRCGGFPEGINAVVFLLHKPIGLGKREDMITADNREFRQLLRYIDRNDFPYKIGFDSCTVPALLALEGLDTESVDTCEAARWSAYISPDMKIMPCSFDNQSERWAVDLRTTSIAQAWKSDKFNDFRKNLRYSCPKCDLRELCMGGCPIVPEIVVCQRKERMLYENKN